MKQSQTNSVAGTLDAGWASRIVLVLILFFSSAQALQAWVYPEHRDIMLLAIQQLDGSRRAVLDRLWADARLGYELRLCAVAADATQTEKPGCIDYAAWPAIAGDHSCSPRNMLENILQSDWILDVADVTARLKRRIAEAAGVPYKRINALRDSDIELQRADPEYATRAGSNNVHFLLARAEATMTPRDYGLACLSAGSELNAIGAYSMFHVSALEKAVKLHRDPMSKEDRSALSRALLADEAFAVHFLEDTFASGHVAGTRGDAAQRKGTHDYYNEYGVEAKTWNGKTFVLVGDAWMRPEDAERAAAVVKLSLEELLDAVEGKGPTAELAPVIAEPLMPNSFNVCRESVMPNYQSASAYVPMLVDVLNQTPIPGLAAGLGELPRFRSELGPFIGVSPAIRGATISGGFGEDQNRVGGIGSLELGVRLGLGLEGVMNESGDGLVFLDLGFRQDAASTTKITADPDLNEYGTISAAIPQRSTFIARLRMPFWLIPGDLLVAAPFLGLAAPQTYTQMAVVAGNGGLIPWQSGIATPIGRFQFMLGREVGVAFFGLLKDDDRFILPMRIGADNQLALLAVRSLQVELPILEYRPFRTFSLEQSSSLVLQLYGGVEFPLSSTVVLPQGIGAPELHTIWMGGLRLAFDWRYYF